MSLLVVMVVVGEIARAQMSGRSLMKERGQEMKTDMEKEKIIVRCRRDVLQ